MAPVSWRFAEVFGGGGGGGGGWGGGGGGGGGGCMESKKMDNMGKVA